MRLGFGAVLIKISNGLKPAPHTRSLHIEIFRNIKLDNWFFAAPVNLKHRSGCAALLLLLDSKFGYFICTLEKVFFYTFLFRFLLLFVHLSFLHEWLGHMERTYCTIKFILKTFKIAQTHFHLWASVCMAHIRHGLLSIIYNNIFIDCREWWRNGGMCVCDICELFIRRLADLSHMRFSIGILDLHWEACVWCLFCWENCDVHLLLFWVNTS